MSERIWRNGPQGRVGNPEDLMGLYLIFLLTFNYSLVAVFFNCKIIIDVVSCLFLF
jgi:hypothetical protein